MGKLWFEKEISLEQLRSIAINSVGYEFRKLGRKLSSVSAKEAYIMLDEIARVDVTSQAAMFYSKASERQYKLFCRDWRKRYVTGKTF